MQTDTLTATFSALADPTRRAILARLAKGSASVKELSAPFDMSGPAVSKHLRVLESAGLIQRGREAQWRPRTLDAAPLKAVAEWTSDFRRFWDASFSRLDRYLDQLTEGEKTDDHRTSTGRDRLHHAHRSRSRRHARRRRTPRRRV